MASIALPAQPPWRPRGHCGTAGVQVERPKTGAKPDARPAGRSPGLGFQRGGAFAWTGEVNFDGNNFNARVVNLDNGNDDWNNVNDDNPVAVCLRP